MTLKPFKHKFNFQNFNFEEIVKNLPPEINKSNNENTPTDKDRIAALEKAIADLALLFTINN